MNKVGALFVISLILINTSPNSSAELDVRSSAALEEFAQNLQNDINAATSNPCDNYFDFICDSAVPNRNISKYKIVDKLRELFNGSPLDDFEGDIQINNFLKSCKEADLSQLPASVIKFSRLRNYWPAFNPNWTESKFDINIVVSELNSFGFDAFFELELENEGNELIIEISPEEVSVSKNVESILNYTSLSREQIAEIIDDCMQLKNEYRKIIKSAGEDTDLETDISSLDDTIIPEINWMRMSDLILGEINTTSYRVIIKDVNKLKATISLIFSADPKWIANYLFYLYVKKGVSYLDIKRPDRHENFCRDAPLDYFSYNVFHKVVRNHNNPKKQKIFMDVIKLSANYLKNEGYAFEEYTSADELYTALDNELTEFLEDIEQASSTIYSGLDMIPDDFFYNRLRLKRFSTHNFNKKLENSQGYTGTEVNKFFPRKAFITLMFSNYSEITPVIFNFLAKPFISQVISYSTKTKAILNMPTLEECLKTQVNCRKKDFKWIAENLLEAEALFNTFKEFSLKYPDIVKSEEVIFEKQGLTSKKALFMIFMQQYCDIQKYRGKTSEATNKKRKMLAQLANYEHFGLEYGCPVGSPMNPVVKCH